MDAAYGGKYSLKPLLDFNPNMHVAIFPPVLAISQRRSDDLRSSWGSAGKLEAVRLLLEKGANPDLGVFDLADELGRQQGAR